MTVAGHGGAPTGAATSEQPTAETLDPSGRPTAETLDPSGNERAPGRTPGSTPTLFEWPVAEQPSAELLRRFDIEQLVALERAASDASNPVARFWRELAASTETAMTPGSLDALFRDSLRAISRLLGVQTVAILLANERGDELVARAATGLSEELTLGIGIRAGEGMAGRVLATRRPLLVGDLSEVHVVNPVLRHSGLRSVVAVPLLARGHPLGVVYAASYDLERFTEADASVLELLADRLAAALDRVRLFEAERAARRDAERLARRIGHMQTATAHLAAVGSSDEAAHALADALVDGPEESGPWWVAVWLLDGTTLVPAHHVDRGAGLPAPVALDLGGDRTPARAARTGVPVYHSGPEPPSPTVGHSLVGRPAPPANPAVATTVAQPPFAGGAFAALPLASPGQVFGVVALAYPGWLPFDHDQRHFLESVVRQASVAFDRARLAAHQEQLAGLATFFAGAARSLADAPDLPATLERLADLSLEALGELCLIDMVDEDGQLTRRVARHRHRDRQGLADRLRDEFGPDPRGQHPAIEVLRNGITRWSDRMSADFLRAATRDPEHFSLTQALGFRSYITVGIISGGEIMGALTTVSTSRSFGRDDVALAEQLARQVGGLVDTARRFDRAAHTSRVLQAGLLPRSLPEVPGLTVETRYLPGTKALEVGGDFYDLYLLPSGLVAFALGDVGGHDRAAAALMGHLRTAGRALATAATTPAALVDALRANWDLLEFDRIATAVFGTVDPQTGAVVLASAGHYPPLRLSEQGAHGTYLPISPSPPFGVPAGPATNWRGELARGEVLLLFTDGAVDERGAGSEASMAALAHAAGAAEPTPRAVCNAVIGALAPDRLDDVALLGLRFDDHPG